MQVKESNGMRDAKKKKKRKDSKIVFHTERRIYLDIAL